MFARLLQDFGSSLPFSDISEDSPAILMHIPDDVPFGEQGELASLNLQVQSADHEADGDSHSENSWEVVSSGQGSPRAGHGHPPAVQPELAPVTEEPAAAEADALASALLKAAAEAGEEEGVEQQQLAAESDKEAAAASTEQEEVEEEEPGSPFSHPDSCIAHKVYSMSQEGSIDGYSDSETHHTDELMAQGEPDHHARFELAGAGACPAPKTLFEAVSKELSRLSARMHTFAASSRITAEAMGAHVWETCMQWLEMWQERFYQEVGPQLRIMGEELSAVGHRVREGIARLAKQAPHKRIDWAKVVLATGCVGLAALLYRSRVANQQLALKLAQRDTELAELVSRILTLRNRSSSVPIIRPAACHSIPAWGPLMHAV